MTAATIYGLRVEADRPIPGLAASPITGVDLRIRVGAEPPRPAGPPPRLWYTSPFHDERGQPALSVWALGGGGALRFRYTDGVEFLIDGAGRELWMTWPETSTLADAASYLLGPILGFVLRLHGIVGLHASAVAAGGRALALLGAEGAGKSTTAAAFAARGHAVVTDDILALSPGDPVTAHPGYPRLRLWPASAEALSRMGGAVARLAPIPGSGRQHLDLAGDGGLFQRDPLPLAAIYLLGARRPGPGAIAVEPMRPAAALMALVANTFATRLLDRAMRAREFETLGRLVLSVPVRCVHAPADIARLPELCEAILADSRCG